MQRKLKVAKYRPQTPVDTARATEARCYIGEQAITEHLADTLETPDALLTRLATEFTPTRSTAKRKAMTTENLARAPIDEETLTPETPDAPPPSPPVPVACNPLTLSEMCLKADEPNLIPLLLKTLHTPAEVEARIAQAKAVRHVCALAKTPELADGLIASGASPDQAKLITWNSLVARDEAASVDSTPRQARAAMTRAEFQALSPHARAEYCRSGGTVTD